MGEGKTNVLPLQKDAVLNVILRVLISLIYSGWD